MTGFKEWFEDNYTHRGGLQPSDNLIEVIDEYTEAYTKAKLKEASDEKEMYKQCFEIFIPNDKWDEATEFLSTNGGKLPDFDKKQSILNTPLD